MSRLLPGGIEMLMLYASTVDVSLSNGPGVNESEFLRTLSECPSVDVRWVLPRPSVDVPSGFPMESGAFRLPSRGNNPFSLLRQELSLFFAIRQELRNHRRDMLLMRVSVFPIGLWMLVKSGVLKRLGVTYMLKTAGSGEFSVFKRKNFVIRAFRGVSDHMFRCVVRNASLVDCVSERHVRLLSRMVESDNIVWIDNGVNTERFKPLSQEEVRRELDLSRYDLVIGYAGNRPWERGGMHVIEALPRLISEFGNVGAVIVGGGEGLGLLKQRARELGVADSCFFPGQIPLDEVPAYINTFDVAVSFRTDAESGASPLKVRQYLACGKPVITTPGSNDFVEEEGLGTVVDYNNIEQIQQALRHWLSMDSIMRRSVSKKARSYALSNLSLEARIKERLEYYEAIVHGHQKYDQSQ